MNFFPALNCLFLGNTYGKRNVIKLVQYLSGRVQPPERKEPTLFWPLTQHKTICLSLYYLADSKAAKYSNVVFYSRLPFSLKGWNSPPVVGEFQGSAFTV